jgi:MSHA biogenesis protein MshO
MRPILRSRGVTLIELVVAMVVLAIVMALVTYFVLPVRQAVDVAIRAELTDAADNALQRITREVRLSLPNSVRVASAAGSTYLEFLPSATAGRYRADGGGASSGTDCPATGSLGQPSSDQLSFGIADTCFKSIGSVQNCAPLPQACDVVVAGNDFVVLNNLGPGFANQDAYLTASTNKRRITARDPEPTRVRITLAAGTFTATEHDSPGKRFYVVPGNGATLLPVTYECTGAGTLLRRTGYAMTETQAASFAGGTAALLAAGVTQCAFDYLPNVAPQAGLLTLRLGLSRARSDGGTETVSLYHSVHVVNVP